MTVNNPHSVDRKYKFLYKTLGIKFHRYFYDEGKTIEFIETEIPDTGQRKDIVAKIDDKLIKITEIMATALYEDKLKIIFDYHDSTRNDPQYAEYEVQSSVISISNPNHGKNEVNIDRNITFHVDTIFTKNKDGKKVLSKIIYKTITQEELSDNEAIDLLILPDMDIDIPVKSLIKLICFIILKANIPDADFKNKIILCEIMDLSRFFKDNELKEMINMLKTQTHPEVARVIEKYGMGFDTIYFNGSADTRIEIAQNFLKDGFDEEIISRNTGLPLDQIKKLKRKL